MHVVIILLVLIIVTGWAGFELRTRQPGIAQALWGFSILFALLLLGAFFNLV